MRPEYEHTPVSTSEVHAATRHPLTTRDTIQHATAAAHAHLPRSATGRASTSVATHAGRAAFTRGCAGCGAEDGAEHLDVRRVQHGLVLLHAAQRRVHLVGTPARGGESEEIDVFGDAEERPDEVMRLTTELARSRSRRKLAAERMGE